MPGYALTVQPPLGGIDRSVGFQNQPPFSSYESIDFWPLDIKTQRRVTGTRPTFAEPVAPGATVNAFVPVNGHLSNRPKQSLVAASSGTLYWWDGAGWVLATGAAASSADTGRAVYGTPYLLHAYICKADSAPIDFDYVTGAASIMSTFSGTVPDDCRVAFTWQSSLCLAGQIARPHIVYMSRTGDAYDWDFSAEDEGGAFTSAGDSEGLLNGPITAGFAHTSDTAIISTVEGIVAWRDHPRRGGRPELISSQYILGQGAWCKTPDDAAWYMTPNGLYMLPPNPGAIPAQVSRKKIPNELIGLDYDYEDPSIAMAYDSWSNLVHITDRTAEIAFTFDPVTGGFHRAEYDNYPYVMFEFLPFVTEDRSGVLWGKSA